jgi:hypothetical protein
MVHRGALDLGVPERLRRYPIKGRRRSLRQVADELATAGYVLSAGTPYTATAILRIIET